MKIEIKAPAKVNLFLNVLGKRADGYHDIQSLLVPVSLFDRVVLDPRDTTDIKTVLAGGLVKLDGIPWPASMPDSADNLATRAAIMLKSASKYPKGALITIEKNIPVAGGLGGGSSDAAAALKGLNQAWQTELSIKSLMKLAENLGSDVPALVHGGIVRMEGRGERIIPLAKPPVQALSMLLVNPGVEISTADIYSRYTGDLTFSEFDDKFNLIISGLHKGCLETIGKGLFNSLQKTAFHKYPLLRLIKNKLEKAGAVGVLLSGTGATLLALVRDREHGAELDRRFRKTICCPVWTSLVETVCADNCPMV